MDKNEIIDRLERLARCAIHTEGELPFVMSLDDGIAIHEAIDMLRQSQQEPPWIPCSERLPEQPNPNPELEGKPLDIYLVCKQDNIPFRAFWNGRNFADGWTSLDVDAWMPLPEPYRAERRTND